MLHLTLTTDQTNCLKSKNEIIWTMPHLDLACYQNVGLSSLVADLGDSRDHKLVTVSTSIIDRNLYNPSGIICVIPGTTDVLEHSRSFEQWPLDSIRPRYISFYFDNPSVNIEYCQITLVFTRENNATQVVVIKSSFNFSISQ